MGINTTLLGLYEDALLHSLRTRGKLATNRTAFPFAASALAAGFKGLRIRVLGARA